MSFPAVSGRRRSRDCLHMDDTVAASDEAPADGFVRVHVPVLVDGEMTFYELDYRLPRRDIDDEYLDALWRRVEDPDRVLHGRDRKRARAASSDDDAIRRCLRKARAGDAGMPEECAVCLKDFDAKAQEKLRVMPSCSHAFHPDCIFTWLRVKAVCPLCRHALPTPAEQHFGDEDDSGDEDSDEDDTDSDQDSDEDDTY